MQTNKQKRLDHPDHFHHNQPASVAALRSLIGIRRNADRLPSGTLIEFTRIRTQYGPLYSIVPEIDADVAAGTSTLTSTTFSRNWIISCWLTEVAVMKRDEIIWAYKKRTKHSVNFIPTGSSFGLVLRDTRGKLIELTSSEQNVDLYLKSLAEQTPWVVFGYDGNLEKLYKKERRAFAQTVSERRAAMGATKA